MLVAPEPRLPVPDRLRDWVTGAWLSTATTTTASPDRPAVRLPDTATSLVLRRAGERADLLLVGPQTRASYLTPLGGPVCVALRLRPGRALALLGAPPRDLVDRTVALADYWGVAAPQLAGRLTGDPDVVLAALAAALLDRVPADAAPAGRTVPAVRALAAGERTGAAARRIGVGERQLRNLFHAEVGLSPKQVARIDRLRRVLAATGALAEDQPPGQPAGTGAPVDPRRVIRGWAELASTAGYYDQAHLTGDFVELLGVPPGAFLAGRLPAPTRCALAG
jgi:AraC-like DNA-binding protein